jgi:hypothetical protein
MQPVILALAVLTSAASVLSMILVSRALRSKSDPWGENPWETESFVEQEDVFQAKRPESLPTGPSRVWLHKLE